MSESQQLDLVDQVTVVCQAAWDNFFAKVDAAWAGVLGKITELGESFNTRCGELGTAIGKSVEGLRPSPTPAPTAQKTIAPSRSITQEQSLSPTDARAEVMNALQNNGLGNISSLVTPDWNFSDVGVGAADVGCASYSMPAMMKQSSQLMAMS